MRSTNPGARGAGRSVAVRLDRPGPTVGDRQSGAGRASRRPRPSLLPVLRRHAVAAGLHDVLAGPPGDGRGHRPPTDRAPWRHVGVPSGALGPGARWSGSWSVGLASVCSRSPGVLVIGSSLPAPPFEPGGVMSAQRFPGEVLCERFIRRSGASAVVRDGLQAGLVGWYCSSHERLLESALYGTAREEGCEQHPARRVLCTGLGPWASSGTSCSTTRGHPV